MPRERSNLGEELAKLLGRVSDALSEVDGKALADEISAFLEKEAKLSESVAESVATAVEKLLHHTDSAVRAAAAAIVGNPSIIRSVVADRWLAQLIPPALELLSDADGAVRAATAAALDNVTRWTKNFPILDESAVEKVKAAAESVDGLVRSVAEAILGRLDSTRPTPSAAKSKQAPAAAPKKKPAAKKKKPAARKPAKKKKAAKK